MFINLFTLTTKRNLNDLHPSVKETQWGIGFQSPLLRPEFSWEDSMSPWEVESLYPKLNWFQRMINRGLLVRARDLVANHPDPDCFRLEFRQFRNPFYYTRQIRRQWMIEDNKVDYQISLIGEGRSEEIIYRCLYNNVEQVEFR